MFLSCHWHLITLQSRSLSRIIFQDLIFIIICLIIRWLTVLFFGELYSTYNMCSEEIIFCFFILLCEINVQFTVGHPRTRIWFPRRSIFVLIRSIRAFNVVWKQLLKIIFFSNFYVVFITSYNWLKYYFNAQVSYGYYPHIIKCLSVNDKPCIIVYNYVIVPVDTSFINKRNLFQYISKSR